MSHEMTRRSFIRGSVATAGLVAAKPIIAKASPMSTEKQLTTLLDISKCIGCEACVEACREVNDVRYPNPEKPFPKMVPSRVKTFDYSDKKEVRDRLTPYNWLTIQPAEVEYKGESYELTIPRRCMHCVNPPCVKLCPWGAAKQYENGISQIDADICLGGSKCKSVCPWKIPQRQTGVGLYLDILPQYAGNGVMFKCDRCYERVKEGELPACIEACPEDVQSIGPRAEMIEKANTLAKEMDGFIYGETENGGTNTIYVSPVPFDMIDAAVEKGDGRPHFKKVKNTMESANNIGLAMMLAPVAGIAAAIGKFYKKTQPKG